MQTGFTNMLGILQPGRIDNQGQSPESIRRGRIEDMKINPGNYTSNNRRLNNPNDPILSLNPDFTPSFELKAADPNNLIGGFRPPTSGGGFVTDMRDKTLKNPYESGGTLGLATNDGLGGGALFLPDENRPRSEEDIRNSYEKAKAKAAEQRRNGFLGQVVLPGEMKYEDFKNMNNSFFLKRNPNIPESAYSNFDLTNVGGFDNPATDGGSTAPPESATPMNPFRKAVDVERGDSLKTGGIGSLQPYQPAYQNNMNQFKDFEKRLENIEQGVGSLLDKNQMYTSNNMGVQGYSSTGYSPNSVIGNLLRWSYR